MDGGRTKKAEVIEEVFDRLDISENDKAKCIMIGDRMFDIEGASIKGIDSIGVKYGYATPNELEDAGATYVVETTEELMALIKELAN